ncbi:MAG: hypothetical protein ACI8UD_000392 [Planctomycetota bacterium]
MHIHGHGQCVTCNTNVEPCCGGDNGNDAASKAPSSAQVDMTPQLFPTLFDGLGGRTVTVTTDALLYALSNRLACDYGNASLVLEAAERVGIVRTRTPGQHRLQDVAVSPVDPSAPAP